MAGFEGLASQTWSSESDDEPPEKMARSSVSQLEATDGGSILRRGIRFDSEEDFAKFVGQKAKKSKRAKKKKRRKDVDGNFSTIDEGPKMSNGEGFDSPRDAHQPREVVSEAKAKLRASRFRSLNEKLYTQTGKESFDMFKGSGQGEGTDGAFKAYHEGFAEQVKKWPINPLDHIINSIRKRTVNDRNLVVADFGCGEARLSQTLRGCCKEIHSFDLVALNDLVTVCNFSQTPLADSSVDVAVFCLSLMGTNLRDFLKEANRVLKPTSGVLKIAEVESRFKDVSVEDFVSKMAKFGFQLKRKDPRKGYFHLMDFVKVGPCDKKKLPQFSLNPCLYKKR